MANVASMARGPEDSVSNTEANSPIFSSADASASTTSLSSLDEPALRKGTDAASPNYGRLIDTLGNEFQVPDYTIKDIRDAIPKHCFQRSALRGYGYVARDLAVLASVFYVFYQYVTPEYIPYTPVRAGLWAAYTIVQGLFGTGVWILAHECGHGAFSDSTLVNDLTGWVLHSALLVPYFSWQISHSKHHKATGHIERDMVFAPRRRPEQASRLGRLVEELGELTEETPIYTLMNVVLQQLFGWPMYLLTNVTGHNNHEAQREGRGKGKHNGFFGGVNHFDPRSPLYEARDAKKIVYSDIGLMLVMAGLTLLVQKFGFVNMLVWYFIPYLWVNHWLVAITFLQHTDPQLPHYTAEEWNFVRGAAATIDRDMGFIGRHILHGIADTHVLHHYVSNIPFYHADEATEGIKKVMGPHYRLDNGGFWGFLYNLYRCTRLCQWVEPSAEAEGPGKGVLFFRNHNQLGAKPLTGEQYKALVSGKTE